MKQIPVNDITPKPTREVETYDLYAKREHIYVKFYKGIYKNLRIISGAIMLVLFYGSPWIQWGDRQAILFDLPSRQFHVFSATFWPQDFILLSGLLIILTFVLFVATVFAGRLWCGYACPQFVWTWLFIWAERITEGDRNQRMRQDKKPMTAVLWCRKLAKHSIWFVLSITTALAFVGYFTPIRELTPSFVSLALGPWELWWIGFIAVATYGNAGWLREQVCIYMCPYARFQSVMFDSNTLIISYDEKRGESRGKRSRKTDYVAEGLGDCIDCNHCVNVCPTGIDIRDGLQIECVACGACVDACDDIMGRIGYAKGLIKYTTETNLEGGDTRILRPKLLSYLLIVIAMMVYFGYVIFDRKPIEVDVHRDRSQMFIEVSDHLIENAYTLKIANKGNRDERFIISISGIQGIQLMSGATVLVEAGELIDYPIRIRASSYEINQRNTPIDIRVEAVSDPDTHAVTESRFMAPVN